VDGRKLFVDVEGQTIEWETIGFADTRHMPPLSPDLRLVATFLADRRVRPVLEKWRIGWVEEGRTEPAARNWQAMALDGLFYGGTNPADCSLRSTCPIRTGVTNVCEPGMPAHQGLVVSQDTATFGTEMDIVSTCCGSPISGTYRVKVCSADQSLSTVCGIVPFVGACKACPGSGASYSTSCSLSARATGAFNATGLPIYTVHHCDATPGTPPAITVGVATDIWPPDRKMHSFTLADFVSALDACDNPINVNTAGTITSITSNEPEADDIAITGSSSFEVRADRDGSGRGRVYEISFSVLDASGNSAAGLYVVRVPHHSQGLGAVR
jgi:hypothetical protein